jgi:hypothetical protein
MEESHKSMPRYQIGDRIKILSDGATRFAGLEGVIQELQPHDRGVTVLDRYIVLFQWGERQTFYDVQLALVDSKKAATSEDVFVRLRSPDKTPRSI